jgi:hypothetical protein
MRGLATWGLIGILVLIIIMQASIGQASTSSVPLEDPWGTDQPLVSKGTQLVVTCGTKAEDVIPHLPDGKTAQWTAKRVGDGCTGWWHLVGGE